MKVYEVPLNLAEHDSDIKIKACNKKISVICNRGRFCAYNLLRYQVSVYRTIGPLVSKWFAIFLTPENVDQDTPIDQGAAVGQDTAIATAGINNASCRKSAHRPHVL